MTPWIEIAGWSLTHFVWQGLLIGLVAALALRLLRGAAANARYLTACAAMAAMLAAPALTAYTLGGGLASSLRAAAAAALSAAPAVTAADSAQSPTAPARPPHSDTTGAAPAMDSATTATSLPTAVVTAWTIGVLVLLLRLAGGWMRLRRLRQSLQGLDDSRWRDVSADVAARLGLARAIRVVNSALVDTPTVVGWVRPVILLPIAAFANLTPSQIEAILAHEIAHIRRHDFLVNLLQTVAETLLFYHPAVWWLSARIRAEREHCCDDVALQVSGDPVIYAEALIELEAWRTAGASLALAATDGSLVDRVRRLLAPRQRETGVSTVAALITVFTAASAMIAVAAHVLPPTQAAQTAGTATADPSRAVAWRAVLAYPEGELLLKGFTGAQLIQYAYGEDGMPVADLPPWMVTESFDLSATVPAYPDDEQTRAALRRRLEELFALDAHTETRDVPVYELVQASPDGSLGPNLQPSTASCYDATAARLGDRSGLNGQHTRFCGDWDDTLFTGSIARVTMADFARQFSRISPTIGPVGLMRSEVVDRTGLSGTFDIQLNFFKPTAAMMLQNPPLASVLEPLGFTSIPTALEDQLGLRLREATAPRDVIVIDRAERPASTSSQTSGPYQQRN